MKKICLWTGTDALTLVYYPPGRLIWYVKLFFYRIKWRILHRFFDEHWARSWSVADDLDVFGIRTAKIYPSEIDVSGIRRKTHKGVNVLYYLPEPVNLGGYEFRNWLYGFDIVSKLYSQFFDFTFIRADGTNDKTDYYAIADCYIRPTRSDGMPRMILECEAIGIPYLWSKDKDPKLEDFVEFLNQFKT